MATFAKRLKELMDIRGLSPAELSRQCGLSRATISRYLNEKFEAKQDSIAKIARAANVSEAWLMGYDVPMGESTYSRLLKAKTAVEHINDQLENYTPLPGSRRPPTDEEIKFALFDGAADVTDEMYAEVKRFAAYVYNREEKK